MTTIAHLVADVIQQLDKALHELRIVEVPDYGATNYVVVCGCEWESVQVTTRAEAEAQVAAGCPVDRLEVLSASRRARRIAAQAA